MRAGGIVRNGRGRRNLRDVAIASGSAMISLDDQQPPRRPAGPPDRARRRRRPARRVLRRPPRPVGSRPAGRVRDLRPPRLGVPCRLQRGAHPGHDRGHLPLPLRPGVHGPAVHRPRHPRAVRAGLAHGARGAGRRTGSTSGSTRRDGFTPTPAVSHAILVANRGRSAADGLADGIVVTPSHNPPDDGGFKYNPPNGGPADTDVTRWIQDEANRILEASGTDGLDGVARVPFERARATAAGHDFLGRLRRRPRQRRRHGGDRGVGPADRRRPARRRGGRLLGRDRGAVRARPDRHQPDGRPDVRVHDPRLGREDPDGPVLAVRDGPPRRAARPVRPRARQRRRRRPPRDRRPGRPGS